MSSRRVLLVGWDAADWKVIQPLAEAGKMPHVQRLIVNGVAGPIATLHPPLSPMLWTSIATGKRPFRHGILGFTEPAPDGNGVRPVTNLSRKAKALWNILSQNHLRSIVIGWWPSHPAEPIRGVMVSDQYHRATGPLEEGWLISPGAVHPPELAATLAALRVHPDTLTPDLVQRFIPRAKEIDQDKDQRLAAFLRTLAECMSIQSAAVRLLEHERWDFAAVYYDSIDHFCHAFMRYHPPRQAWIGQRDFELYKDVVSMGYQFHDEMLGKLLAIAGDDATVILMSDHGFHPDHLRPASIPDIPAGPAIEHRDYGIFAASGPRIRKGERLHGASLLDVAPTILTLFGLPIGEDMDGRVLSQAFIERPRIASVRGWEEIPGDDGRHPPHTGVDPLASHAVMQQMIALGYIQPPDPNREQARNNTIRELRYNLGESYQDAGRHVEAHQIFTALHAAAPEEQRFAVRLFVSAQALGLHDEMRKIVEDLDRRRPSPVAQYLRAQLLIAEKQWAEALAALQSFAGAYLMRPGVFLEMADLYLRLGRPREARQVCEKALALDPDHAAAHLSLCRIALRQRRYSVAARAALDALERSYQDALAHFLLGRALMGMKEYQRAADALRAAISFNPNFPEAHVRLAALLNRQLGDPESAREHRRLAGNMRRRRSFHPLQAESEQTTKTAQLQPHFENAGTAPLSQSLVIVTGLPRSGTSLVMQMLAAGGAPVLSDNVRAPDEDNPRGYVEFEPVKNLLNDSKWLRDARGKAVKIIAPLLAALPGNLACRVIFCERDLDEVLHSQRRMLLRRNAQPDWTTERRNMLREEFSRTLGQAKTMLLARPDTQLLAMDYATMISNPLVTAEKISSFLGGGLNTAAMAAAVDPALYRNRALSPC